MTLRHRIEITDAAGNVLADVVDDEVSVLAGRWLAARFHELEVAIRDETAPELIHTLPERLRQAGAGVPDPTRKDERALGSRTELPPQVTGRASGATNASPGRRG
jgi:hypothetical protein